jgi:hypothetical protein
VTKNVKHKLKTPDKNTKKAQKRGTIRHKLISKGKWKQLRFRFSYADFVEPIYFKHKK